MILHTNGIFHISIGIVRWVMIEVGQKGKDWVYTFLLMFTDCLALLIKYKEEPLTFSS